MMAKWMLYTKKENFNEIGKKFNISPMLARIMVNRNVRESEQIRKYLYGTMEDLYDPKLLLGMEAAVSILVDAIEEKKKIVIASDFDVDGIFSSMILYTAFRRVGGQCYIDTPNRVTEGYGLNKRIVDNAIKEGASVLITCDNGIAALEPVQYAKELGMQVIVTDHHEVPFSMENGKKVYHKPMADVIVNPKQAECGYPFKKLCGAGVTFKLAQVLYAHYQVPKEEEKILTTYAAIATVADVMDLEDENRILVKTGLRLLENTSNVGLRALLRVTELEGKKLTAYHIGFVIGPCFNAAGRLETVKRALDLLLCENEGEAMTLATNLKELNETRKEMTEQGTKQAITKIEESSLKDDKVLVVKLENCHESLVGIIAGRLRERYYKPTIVFTQGEEGLKGSGRSIPPYNMFEELSACKDLLDRFGGHPMAAGMTVQEERLDLLRQSLNANTTMTQEDLIPKVWIDIPLPIQYVTEAFVEELSKLEPYGKGNEKPLFAEQHLRVTEGRIIGKNKNVYKARVANPSGARIDAIYFGDVMQLEHYIKTEYGEENWYLATRGQKNTIDLGVVYYPTINEFRDQRTPQIVMQEYCHIQTPNK